MFQVKGNGYVPEVWSSDSIMLLAAGAVPTILRNGTPDSTKYLFAERITNEPKTASQLNSNCIEMHPTLNIS